MPHVGIVTAYDSATKTVTYVDGNSNDAVQIGTCKWKSGAKVGSQYVYGYGRPAYSNSLTVTSTTPVITSEKYVYNVGESITLQRNIVKNSNYYWISLWHDGKEVLATSMDDVNYVLSNLQVGLYDVFLQVGNAVATEQTSYTFAVQETVIQDHEHDFSEYTIDKKATLNEWGIVTFTCSGCDATEEYGIPEIGAVLLAKHEYTYNGKKNKPSVTVIDVEGNKLVKGTDYSVEYSGDGKKEGRYKVTVTFKGIYSGTKNLYYYVVPKEE